jgi:radical SAM superfamily enzyme YgiQ (UPF0313 family)
MKILLLTPPITQFNTAYPATPYLKSFLTKIGHDVRQVDVSLEFILKLFSKEGLQDCLHVIQKINPKSDSLEFFCSAFDEYQKNIDHVMAFLQSGEHPQIEKLRTRKLLPEGPRFIPLDEQKKYLKKEMKQLSQVEQAKYIASLFLDDLADYIKEGVDELFGFSRYGEKLAASQNSFQDLYTRSQKDTILDRMIKEITANCIQLHEPQVVGITAPFPGNMLGALKIAQFIKNTNPEIKIVLGGGYVNTELRNISDPHLFEFVDFLTFDDGEKPFEQLLLYLENKIPKSNLFRTYYCEEKQVIQSKYTSLNDYNFKNLEAPDYSGLDFNRYVSMIEMPNFVHRLWTDGKWNKMILAHGCYWKKCTFCDVSLDYIGRFEPDNAKNIVDKIETIMAQTGSTGFHFVDEAAPPTLLKSMSEELLKRNLKITWWGNIRFDPFFTKEVALLMKQAGCIAVTGGIEVASERILKLINKGITIEQVAKVTKNFHDSNIYVHAYLMYGFPTQTAQETIDSLEVVRQLFLKKYLHSAYWHRFSATAHAPVGLNPNLFKIKLKALEVPKEGLFAHNDLEFSDDVKVNHDMLGVGLKRALYNYMLGLGFDLELQAWFDMKVPQTTYKSNLF